MVNGFNSRVASDERLLRLGLGLRRAHDERFKSSNSVKRVFIFISYISFAFIIFSLAVGFFPSFSIRAASVSTGVAILV